MSSTAPSTIDDERNFRITHPFHPLSGRSYVLITHKLNWGEDRVSFKDEKGHYHSIPAYWTDVVLSDPYERPGDPDSYFRLNDLLEIRQIVQKLKTKEE
jgi:hypothetical protein